MTLPPDALRLIETRSIGSETTIGVFTHVFPGAHIGRGCSIADHVTIGNGVTIGDRVVIDDGANLSVATEIGDEVVIGPHTTFVGNTRADGLTIVRRGARIGAGVVVLGGLTIGRSAVIEAGTVVIHDVPANAIVGDHPARIRGYAGASQVAPDRIGAYPPGREARSSKHVRGVELIELPVISDFHGRLAVGEVGHGLPFHPKRFFVVYDVPSRDVRGEHAHRSLHQLLVCLHGACSIVVDDGLRRERYRLDSPSIGLHLGPMVWANQSDFSADSALLVLASAPYDAEDYIRDYDEFVAAVSR